MAFSASTLTVANLALGMLGEQTVTDPNFNGPSKEDDALATHFEPCLADFLERRRWRKATGRYTLTALAAAPAFGYNKQFQLPADCLAPRDVYDANLKRVTDRVFEGDVVLANYEVLHLKYTKEIGVDKFTGMMVRAFATLLAAELAIPLAETRLALPLAEKAERLISKAFLRDAQQNHSAENSSIARQAREQNDTLNSRGGTWENDW